jgi:hypothetical protein
VCVQGDQLLSRREIELWLRSAEDKWREEPKTEEELFLLGKVKARASLYYTALCFTTSRSHFENS